MRRARRLSDRLGEQLRDRSCVAGEYFRRPARVVEPDERVDGDEPALRQLRPERRQRNGRLELCDMVVTEVPDDRHVEPVRLVEGQKPVAEPDEGVLPEAAVLDRFEQERGAPARAQAEVRGERREQVGVDERRARSQRR